jgi:predicted Zn-dependent protease
MSVFETIEGSFRELAPPGVISTLRIELRSEETLRVERGVRLPARTARNLGAMVTVFDGDGLGYAATSDLSPTGLKAAIDRARDWAKSARGRSVADFSRAAPMPVTSEYSGVEQKAWRQISREQKFDWLVSASAALKCDNRILDWGASFWATDFEQLQLTSDGGRIHQRFHYLSPRLYATANDGPETQTRTFGGDQGVFQGGAEILDRIGFAEAARRVGCEAAALLEAPNCPSGEMDLLLAPDQMILQIHESIGHPLELDRILGDERNYAGTSFVTPDMFGTYRYGSPLLNVTFSPGVDGEVAAYAFDDTGTPATREHLIKDGILQRPLGGRTSQLRANLPGVANERACSWNRPPIDRMANLNIEAGKGTRADLVKQVERGVYMETNRSWSIDDSRNKFQFGCELGRVIENGELKGIVRNPNYRGISASFWRSLKAVGGPETVRVLGVPGCGKGEPNQAIRVGHASPDCLFSNVLVFGGH